MIWNTQNPPDCKKAKYLITEGFPQGYGSELHIYGEVLALSVDLGRVLLQHGGWTWRYKNKHCEDQGKKSLECYYHPFSKCTLQDAMEVAFRDTEAVKTISASDTWNPVDDKKLQDLVTKHGNKGAWRIIAKEMGNKTPSQCGKRWKQLRETLKPRANQANKALHNIVFMDDRTIADYEDLGYQYPVERILDADFVDGHPKFKRHHSDRFSDEVLVIGEELVLKDKLRLFVPSQFTHMLNCFGMLPEYHYLWWRAISVTFFIRPNHATQKLLDQHFDEAVKSSHGQCVSAYIRHGDKHLEMRLVPAVKYIEAAEEMWKRHDVPGFYLDGGNERETLASKKKIFYIASENIDAMTKIRNLGSEKNIDVRYSNISQVILSDRIKEVKQFDMERVLRKNREMEYFAYILHLAETIKCEVAICTIPSNYCRLVDELRTTVGGKANRFFIDLSGETCLQPPCVRPHGLGNWRGTVRLGNTAHVREPRFLIWR